MKTVIPEVIVEALVGHSKYLDDAYRRYSLDELKQYYLKGMPNLMIFETIPDLTEINEQLLEKDKQIQDLKNMMDEMKAQIMELRIEKLEKANGF
jgi:hypothetical protein